MEGKPIMNDVIRKKGRPKLSFLEKINSPLIPIQKNGLHPFYLTAQEALIHHRWPVLINGCNILT
jgi:hypothetical protein